MCRLHSTQEVGIRKGGDQSKKPYPYARSTSDQLPAHASLAVPLPCHAKVAVHAHAGQEEDAAKEVDGEEQVRELARHLTEGPVAVLGQRAHPHRQGDAHAQVRNRQVGDIHVRLVARGGVSLSADVHPEDKSIGCQPNNEDEGVEGAHGVEQGAAVERRVTHHRFHTWYVAEGFGDVGVSKPLQQVVKITGAQTHFSALGEDTQHFWLGQILEKQNMKSSVLAAYISPDKDPSASRSGIIFKKQF